MLWLCVHADSKMTVSHLKYSCVPEELLDELKSDLDEALDTVCKVLIALDNKPRPYGFLLYRLSGKNKWDQR